MSCRTRVIWSGIGFVILGAMTAGSSLGWYGMPLHIPLEAGASQPDWFGPPPSLLVFGSWCWVTLGLRSLEAARVRQQIEQIKKGAR